MKSYMLTIYFTIIVFSLFGCSKKDNGSLNPINFESDQVLYINYIRDRSYMGELTDLCYYVDDKEKIKEILNCIDNDIVFQNQVVNEEDFEFATGNNLIKLEIFLEDKTEHKLVYAKDYLSYDGIKYQIYNYNDALNSAWVDILRGYKPIEVESN